MIILSQVLPEHNTQVRPNLWLTESGAVVGYGALLAPNGFVFCFTCATDECQHVQQLDKAWITGQDSQEIPFDGRPVVYESEADDYGLQPEW